MYCIFHQTPLLNNPFPDWSMKCSHYILCILICQNCYICKIQANIAKQRAMASADDKTWQRDAADQNFDYMFKLLIIGNSATGKTSLLFRYADDSFTSAFVSTVGIDFKVKTVFRNDKRVKLQIWDTGEYSCKLCVLDRR